MKFKKWDKINKKFHKVIIKDEFPTTDTVDAYGNEIYVGDILSGCLRHCSNGVCTDHIRDTVTIKEGEFFVGDKKLKEVKSFCGIIGNVIENNFEKEK